MYTNNHPVYTTQEDKVFKAIERLLKSSNIAEWNIVSVVCEAKKYCFKKLSGEIGTVDISFIDDRINAGLY
jgi:hypothetical protein